MTKISQLTDIGSGLASGDEFLIRDVSDVGTPNKKLTANGFMDYVINQASGVGFSQIAAGVGPLSRVRATSSGSTGAVVFETAPSGLLAERARIDSAGRLLVGTSTSVGVGAKLQTVDDSNANPLELIASPNNDQGPNLNTAKARGSTASPTVVSSGDILGRWRFRGYDGSAYQIGADIAVQVDGTPGANDMPGRLVFSTTADGASNPTERMRIGSNGSVQIGAGSQLATEIFRVTSGNSWAAAIEANQNVSGDRNLYLTLGANCNNTSSYFIDCTTATVGPKFYVYGNGTYGTVSDATLKKNIETARDGYLDDIQKLRVVKYNWKTDDDGTPKELGWIAQELAEVFPGLVQDSQPDADGNTVKEVKTSVLQFMLLKALQEANTKIKTLEGRLTAAGL